MQGEPSPTLINRLASLLSRGSDYVDSRSMRQDTPFGAWPARVRMSHGVRSHLRGMLPREKVLLIY
jgi:hypothetical protein